MCGRYALYGPHSRVREKMLLAECLEYAERYNIAPQSTIPIIRFKAGVGRVEQLVKWGLIPAWAKDPSIGTKLTIARSETVAQKPAFRNSFIRHRCIVPASGFYEWKTIDIAGKTRRQPYYIHPTEPDAYFALAALLAAWKNPVGEIIVSTCLITTTANALMAPIHDRMPVILTTAQIDAWLDPANHDSARLQAMLAPCDPVGMAAHPVSLAVNRGSAEGEECIRAVES